MLDTAITFGEIAIKVDATEAKVTGVLLEKILRDLAAVEIKSEQSVVTDFTSLLLDHFGDLPSDFAGQMQRFKNEMGLLWDDICHNPCLNDMFLQWRGNAVLVRMNKAAEAGMAMIERTNKVQNKPITESQLRNWIATMGAPV